MLEETTLDNAGSSLGFNITLKRDGDKKKKKLFQHGVFVFGQTFKY